MKRLSSRFLSAALLVGLAATPGAAAEPIVGGEAPLFELTTMAGESLALADLKGRLVVLHFGAGW